MRAIKKAYLHLCGHLESKCLDALGVPIFKHIDWWNEQTEVEDFEFVSPACFIDIGVPRAEAIGIFGDDLEVQIDFYVCFDTYAEAYAGSSNQLAALDFLEIMAVLHEQTNGYSAVDIGTISFNSAGSFRTASVRNMYRLSYSTTLRDQSAAEIRKPLVTTTLDLELEIKKRPRPSAVPASGNGDKWFDTVDKWFDTVDN